MSKEAIEHYEAALKEAFPAGARGDVFHHWNEARKALAEQPAQQEPVAAAKKDAVFEASIEFIGTLTGMKPPPIEVAPPEILKPFRDFTEKVCLIFAAPQPAQQDPVAFSQFLSDVVTAAGLLSHGKTDKSLAARISEFAFRLRTSPRPAQRKPLTDEQHSLAYWQHEINKARDEAYLQGFAAGKKEAKCSAG